MQAQALLWRMMATIRRPGSLRGSVVLSDGTLTVGAVDVGGDFCCLRSVFL